MRVHLTKWTRHVAKQIMCDNELSTLSSHLHFQVNFADRLQRVMGKVRCAVQLQI